jgi:hypothetical protein
MIRVFLVITVVIIMPLLVPAQRPKDTITVSKPVLAIDPSTGKIKEERASKIDTTRIKDTLAKAKHSPRKAALRSAIIPGWGQVYNKKYWKLPLVAAGIGIPAYLVYYNQEWYNRTRYAVKVAALDNRLPVLLDKVDPQLLPLVKSANGVNSLINYRNEFRRNRDYAILFGLLLWGLNVVDATVDAHLKDFDVSDDLSFHVKPTILSGNVPGLSLVFTVGKNQPKTISSLR